MTREKIQEYLESFQSEMATGFQECDHKYSQNGTISCIKCGKTITAYLSKWDYIKLD